MDAMKEIQKEMMKTMIEELKKHVPEDVQKDLMEISEIHAKTELRMRMTQKISIREIERYNALVGRHFAKIQDDEVDEIQAEDPEEACRECDGVCAEVRIGDWDVWLDCEGSLHIERIEEEEDDG